MMTEIKLLNKIGKAGIDRFDGAKYTLSEDAASPAGILVRSAAMHEMTFGPELLAIARAGAGVNNIPIDRCSEAGHRRVQHAGRQRQRASRSWRWLRCCFPRVRSMPALRGRKRSRRQDARGKAGGKGQERHLSAPSCSARRWASSAWAPSACLVANAAVALGMDVIGCDPFITVNAAWSLSRAVRKADQL